MIQIYIFSLRTSDMLFLSLMYVHLLYFHCCSCLVLFLYSLFKPKPKEEKKFAGESLWERKKRKYWRKKESEKREKSPFNSLIDSLPIHSSFFFTSSSYWISFFLWCSLALVVVVWCGVASCFHRSEAFFHQHDHYHHTHSLVKE